MNLLEETKKILEIYGKTVSDILWIGTSKEVIENGIEELFAYDYNAGYGCHKVPLNLRVVGKNFWLERQEYDGMEWWEYKTLPKKPKLSVKVGGIKDIKEW